MVRLRLDHPACRDRTGLGIRVAVIDSGITPGHPHVGLVAGGVWIREGDGEDPDFGDRIGHGTAVAAAIREKAPGAELLAVRIFERDLRTRAALLVRGIAWAADHGARLINLSLGTPTGAHAAILHEALGHAAARHAVVVSAVEDQGMPRLPGTLDGVVGVQLDWDCPRDEIRVEADGRGRAVFRASGYPRPIPGVPPERNLKGVSFAVANVTGMLARLLER